MTKRSLRLTVSGLLVAWVAFAGAIAPALLRWIHGGNGPGFLRRMMGGNSSTPLDAYLSRWQHIALRWSLPLLTLAVIAWFVLPAIAKRTAASGERAAGVPEQRPSLATGLVIATWCGLVFGLLESLYLGWKTFVTYEVVPNFRYVSADSLWMAPLMDCVTLLAATLLLYGLARLLRRPVALRWLVGTLAFIGIVSLVLVTGRLAAIAVVVLSLGVAMRLGTWAGNNAGRFLPYVRGTLPPLGAALGAVALAVAVVPRVVERQALRNLPAEAATGPNVIVIVLDTERASNMGLFGYHRPTTPGLAQLAGRGVVFDRALAPSTWTLPSHASMFTGRYPGQLSTGFLTGLDDRWPTIAEAMRDRGYMTSGFVANVVFCTPLFGLNRGFVHYEAQPVSVAMTVESAWLTRSISRLFQHGEERSAVRKDAARITRDFLAWQARQSGSRPYFAFLNYFDAHGPYVSPPAFRSLFAPGAHGPPKFHGPVSSAYKPEELRDVVDAYDGAIAYLDAQLQVLFAELERRGELQKTVVIVTADHGEEFGEHGYIGHGSGIGMPILHVPLLVLAPGLPGGTRIAQPVTLTDLPATVMEFARATPHPFPGRSWSRYWSPRTPADTALQPVYSEYGSRRSVLLGDWHYVVEGTRRALYQPSVDPSEQTNRLAGADTMLVNQLRAVIESHRQPSGAAEDR